MVKYNQKTQKIRVSFTIDLRKLAMGFCLFLASFAFVMLFMIMFVMA